jgi:hypothetical protein
MPSAWFRPPVHNAAPPSLPGVLEGQFPRFSATLRRCGSLQFLSAQGCTVLTATIRARGTETGSCVPVSASDRQLGVHGANAPGFAKRDELTSQRRPVPEFLNS